MDGASSGATSTGSYLRSNDDFFIKGAAARAQSQRTAGGNDSKAPPDACTICLEAITERAVATPCNHLTFDFICLVQWLQEHIMCPLCKAEVREVQYDWRSPQDWKTYQVPLSRSVEDKSSVRGHQGGIQDPYGRRRPVTGRARDLGWGPDRTRHSSTYEHEHEHEHEHPALSRRKYIYAHALYSLHVGANRLSQYRAYIPSDLFSSADLQSRARTFLRRELKVFSFLDNATSCRNRGNDREFLLEYIVAILKTNEAKGADGHARELVSEFLGDGNAGLLLHELDAWLRSPYTRLEDWDGHVQYANSSVASAGKASGARR